MQRVFHSAKELIGMFLVTLILVITTLTILPGQARADEYDATKTANCGWVMFGNCQTEGPKGVVVDNDEKKNNEKDLVSGNLQGKNFTQANLSGANLSQAKLSGANLSGADLSGATLTGANLKGVILTGVDWSGVQMSKQERLALIKASLAGGGRLFWSTAPILSKQDLLNLLEADLHQVNLIEVNLSDADLSRANFSKANLIGANLQGAKLGGVDLTGADLSGAKMPNGKIYKP